MYGGLQPGFWNDGAHGVTTISKADPEPALHPRHHAARRASTLRLRDNGYRITAGDQPAHRRGRRASPRPAAP